MIQPATGPPLRPSQSAQTRKTPNATTARPASSWWRWPPARARLRFTRRLRTRDGALRAWLGSALPRRHAVHFAPAAGSPPVSRARRSARRAGRRSGRRRSRPRRPRSAPSPRGRRRSCGRGSASPQSTSIRAGRTSTQARVDRVRERDRVVERRAAELRVALGVEAAEEVEQLGDERADAARAAQLLRRARARRRPVRHVEPDHRHVDAAREARARRPRGRHQTLNSAAGVRFPSPIEPPISTIRSGRASGSSASRSATFVSGPVATSVTRPARARISLGEERRPRARAPARRAAAAAGPVEPALAVDVRRDSSSRTSGRPAPAATGTSARPASSSTRSAFAVVFSSVWLPATVVTPTQLELGRGEREQQRDRVVVAGVAVEEDRRRAHRAQYRVHLGGGRQRRLRAEPGRRERARGARACGAPPRAARPSRSETTRQAVNASPAAVPSTASTARRRGAGDLAAVLVQRGALGAEGDRDELAARGDLVLEPVDDEQVGLERERPRRRRVHGHERRAPGRGRDDLVAHLELAEHRARHLARRQRPRSRRGRPRSGSRRPRRRGSARARSRRAAPARARRRPRASPASASSAKASSPTAPTIRTRAPSRAAATAWFAPFPPGKRRARRR